MIPIGFLVAKEQLIVAEKFNRYNSTKVNPDKSKLIVINNSETIEEKYIRYGVKNNTKIYPEKPNSSVRFLGVWISEKNNKKFVFYQIIRDVNIIFGLTSHKKLTSKQNKYVINAIVILRIEYKSHLTIFTEYEANRITAKLRQVIKRKMNCSNTIPTVFLKNENVYKLIDFFKRQAENHINNLIIRLNDNGSLGYTSEIRLRQLQNAEWLHNNPLEIWNYNNINSFKSNLIAQVLCIMNNLGIALKYNYTNNDYFKISPGKIPLIDIFKNEYRKYVKSFKNKELLYLEQFLYIGSKALREWDEMRRIYKGKIPIWWYQLLDKVTIDGSRLKREFLMEVETQDVIVQNKEILPYTRIDGRKNQWIISKPSDDEYVYGLLKTKKNEIRLTNSIEIIYYTASKHKKKLLLEKCAISNCIYCKDNKDNVITIEKIMCLIILRRFKKQRDGRILIHQRKSNIEREFIIEKEFKNNNNVLLNLG